MRTVVQMQKDIYVNNLKISHLFGISLLIFFQNVGTINLGTHTRRVLKQSFFRRRFIMTIKPLADRVVIQMTEAEENAKACQAFLRENTVTAKRILAES